MIRNEKIYLLLAKGGTFFTLFKAFSPLSWSLNIDYLLNHGDGNTENFRRVLHRVPNKIPIDIPGAAVPQVHDEIAKI